MRIVSASRRSTPIPTTSLRDHIVLQFYLRSSLPTSVPIPADLKRADELASRALASMRTPGLLICQGPRTHGRGTPRRCRCETTNVALGFGPLQCNRIWAKEATYASALGRYEKAIEVRTRRCTGSSARSSFGFWVLAQK